MKSLFAAFRDGAGRAARSPTPRRIDALYRRHRFRVLVAITIGYAFAYTCRLALSVVKKPLIDEGIFSPQDLGLIGSALFYSYAFGKLVNGFLADHANIKIFFATGVIASALINIGMGFSTDPVGLGRAVGAERLVPGFRRAFRRRLADRLVQQPRARALLRHLEHGPFDGRRPDLLRRRAVRRLARLARRLLGAGAPLHPRRHRHLRADAGPPGDARPAAGRRLEERPPRPARAAARRRVADAAVLDPAHSRRSGCSRLSSATVYVTRYAIASWGILYLQEDRGYGLADASLFMAVGTIAGIAGCLLYGYLSDKLFAARRPPANLLFALAELAGLLLIFFGPRNGVDADRSPSCCSASGLNGLVTSLGGLFAVDIAPKKVAGAAMGFIGVFSYLGAAMQENISGVADRVRHAGRRTARASTTSARPSRSGSARSIVSMLLAATLWRVRLRE